MVEGSQRLIKATERAGLASEKPQPVSGRPWPASEEPQGGGTDGRTYVRTDRFPLYSTGLRPLRFPPGSLPKKRAKAKAVKERPKKVALNCFPRFPCVYFTLPLPQRILLYIEFSEITLYKTKVFFPIETNSVISRVHATLYVTMSVRWSVGRSVTHLLFRCFLGSFCMTAPAQSHATNSAVYPALFL